MRHLQLRWVGQLWQSELLFFFFVCFFVFCFLLFFFYGRYAQKTLVFRGVRRWVLQSLLWWPTSTWSSLRSWHWRRHWRRHQPDPGCGRGMLMTLSASSGRAQLKNSYTIAMGSGRPSTSLWSRKRMVHSHSLTRYSGERGWQPGRLYLQEAPTHGPVSSL